MKNKIRNKKDDTDKAVPVLFIAGEIEKRYNMWKWVSQYQERSRTKVMNETNGRAYEMIQQEELKGIRSRGCLLRHKKSGARVLLIENDDDNKVFSIGFRTPPKDSTGVPHIMEHSVLCGSKKISPLRILL